MTFNNFNNFNPSDLYTAPRDNNFKNFLSKLLERADIKPKFRKFLIDKYLYNFCCAFTTAAYDSENNLEVYEQKGDLSTNKFIVDYMGVRFPQLKNVKGVKVIARLRINYGSKQNLYEIAEKLGYWEYISCSMKERNNNMKHVMEDVFEAFVGALEDVINTEYKIGVGWAIIWKFLKNIFDGFSISLKYEDLYDAKTRLKEIFDQYKTLGKLVYKDTVTTSGHKESRIFIQGNDKSTVFIGHGVANIKPDAQQAAARKAIIYMNSKGYTNKVDDFYENINK